MPSDAPCRAPASLWRDAGSPGPLPLPTRPRGQLSRSGAPSAAGHCHAPRHARLVATCPGPGAWPPGPGYDALSPAWARPSAYPRAPLPAGHGGHAPLDDVCNRTSIHEHEPRNDQTPLHRRARPPARVRPEQEPRQVALRIAEASPSASRGGRTRGLIGRADRGHPRPACPPRDARDDGATPARRTPDIPCRHRTVPSDVPSPRTSRYSVQSAAGVKHRAWMDAPRRAPHTIARQSHAHAWPPEGPPHAPPRERRRDPPHPGCLLSAASPPGLGSFSTGCLQAVDSAGAFCLLLALPAPDEARTARRADRPIHPARAPKCTIRCARPMAVRSQRLCRRLRFCRFRGLAAYAYGFSVGQFRDPGINARLTASPGLSQFSTPFFASWRQDIPHTPLVAWPH
jgi:hypothetical protein